MKELLDFFLKFILAPLIVTLVGGLILLFVSRKMKKKKVKQTVKKSQNNFERIFSIGSIVFLALSIIIVTIFLTRLFIPYQESRENLKGFQEELGIIDMDEVEQQLEEVNAIHIGTCDTPGEATSVFVYRDYAYIADGKRGLQVINVEDKVNPKIIGNYDTTGFLKDVFVEGNFAFLADQQSFTIIDLNNKEDPKLIARYDLFNEGSIYYKEKLSEGDLLPINFPSVNSVFVIGDYAYVTDYIGLKIFDIKLKESPSIVGEIDTFYNSNKVFIKDDFAFVADDIDGMQIIDISSKEKPKKIGMFDTPGFAKDIYVDEGYAYIADDTNCLIIIDLKFKNGFLPRFNIFESNIVSNLDSMFIDNDYIYICNDDNLIIIKAYLNKNILMSECVIIENYTTSGNTNDIYVKDDFIYIVDSNKGLEIIKLEKINK